jgi:hypothetical protein
MAAEAVETGRIPKKESNCKSNTSKRHPNRLAPKRPERASIATGVPTMARRTDLFSAVHMEIDCKQLQEG